MKHLTLALATAITLTALSGCATSQLIKDDYRTETKRTTLIEDRVVAFGNPASNSGVPQNNVVIVGEKQSYVLTEGGQQLSTLLTYLDPKNVQLGNSLDFYSADNDGKFSGIMKLSYVRLKEEFSRSDVQFFLQNGATECTSQSDTRMNAQRYCFDLRLQGAVYPQVNNYALVRSQFRSLSRPYSVTIYTQDTVRQSANSNTVQKLVLLPFALAFDVVTLPLQILGGMD